MYSEEPKKWYLAIHRLRWKGNIKMYLKDVRTCKVINTEEKFPEHLNKRVKTDTYNPLRSIVTLYQGCGKNIGCM
jgi:hypothetical protein